MYKITLGVGITGSFCTFSKTIEILKHLNDLDYNLIPIFSNSVKNFDTRFYLANDFKKDVEDICKNKVIDEITTAEPIGPKSLLDALMILPCTGNTLAKLALGVTDTPVTMAAKSHLRNLKPLLICVSTNDGLSSSLKNIATLYNKKNIYFAPFTQDDPIKKPNSLVVDFDKIVESLSFAIDGKQLQPIIA